MRRHLTFLAVILLVDLLCLYQILLDLGSLVLIRIPSAFGKYLDSIVDSPGYGWLSPSGHTVIRVSSHKT